MHCECCAHEPGRDALLGSDRHRARLGAVGDVADVRGLVDHLVERDEEEVGEHDLDDRPHAADRRPDAGPEDRRLRDRGVEHPLAERLAQAAARAVGAAGNARRPRRTPTPPDSGRAPSAAPRSPHGCRRASRRPRGLRHRGASPTRLGIGQRHCARLRRSRFRSRRSTSARTVSTRLVGRAPPRAGRAVRPAVRRSSSPSGRYVCGSRS